MTDPAGRSKEAVNEIFGDALPETRFDERDNSSRDEEIEKDRWLNDNVPPHH
ncbi:MAG: hypothetical protein AB7G47_05015 [Mycolicibacterium sp.]|uniref:hypothetical protein n=1 Tax=Mycolicibacterium sp. TaxID=2320850 RepID=UPI003D125DEA